MLANQSSKHFQCHNTCNPETNKIIVLASKSHIYYAIWNFTSKFIGCLHVYSLSFYLGGPVLALERDLGNFIAADRSTASFLCLLLQDTPRKPVSGAEHNL